MAGNGVIDAITQRPRNDPSNGREPPPTAPESTQHVQDGVGAEEDCVPVDDDEAHSRGGPRAVAVEQFLSGGALLGREVEEPAPIAREDELDCAATQVTFAVEEHNRGHTPIVGRNRRSDRRQAAMDRGLHPGVGQA